MPAPPSIPSVDPTLGSGGARGAAPRSVGFYCFAGHLWTIFGLALSNALLAIAAIATWRGRHRLTRPWHEVSGLMVPLAVYMGLLALSALASHQPEVSVPELKEIFSLATVALAVLWLRDEQAIRRVLDGLLIMVTIFVIHGIGQNYLGGYGSLHHRVVGLFSHYQTFSGVLLLGLLLLCARLLAGGEHRRPWHALALVPVLWALLLTLTRGAWVAAIVTLSGLLLVRFRRRLPLFLVGGAMLAIAFGLLAPDSWNERMRSIVDLRDPSNYDRLCMTEAGFHMVTERPLFGLGPEMVAERYPIYRHPTAPRFTVPHLHNSFLQIATEQGLLGLAAYGWLMLAGVALAWRGYRRDGGFEGPRADLYLAALLTLVGFNLAGLFEDNWRDTEIQRWILFTLAIPCGLPPLEPTPQDTPDSDARDSRI